MSSRVLRSSSRTGGGGTSTAAAAAETGDRRQTGSSVPVKRKLADGDPNPDSKEPKQKSKSIMKDTKQTLGGKPEAGSSVNSKANGNVDLDQSQSTAKPLPTVPAGIGAMKAMQNNLVLKAIATKLLTEDLSSLRQTCKLWNRDLAPKVAAQHKPIDLQTDEERVRRAGTWGYPECPGWMISEFTNSMISVWQSSTSIASGLGGYNIHDLDSAHSANQQEIRSFFSTCGHTVTRLELGWNGLNIASAEVVRKIIFEWTPTLQELILRPDWAEDAMPGNQVQQLKKVIPKLRKLTVFAEVHEDNPSNPSMFHLVEDILESAVGLEHLTFDGWDTAGFVRLLAPPDPHKFPALGRLKYLKVWRLKTQHLRILTQLASRHENPLQLVELVTTIVLQHPDPVRREDGPVVGDAETNTLLSHFLVTQQRTLRRLELRVVRMVDDDDDEDSPRLLLSLPKLDNLQSLILERDGWRFGVQCESGTLQDNFPGLKHLEFSYDSSCYASSEDEIIRVGVPLNQLTHNGVTSFKFGLHNQDDDETLNPPPLPLSTLSQTWPFITKLELKIQPTVFKLLSSFWTLWPALLSLRVDVPWLGPFRRDSRMELRLDELLSGIPSTRFKFLRRQVGPQPTIETLRALQSQFKVKPGICDLTQLQEFVLDCGPNWFNINDIGAYFGLAMMPQTVQHLALIHRERGRDSEEKGRRVESKGNRIPEECRRFLRQVFGPYTVIDL